MQDDLTRTAPPAQVTPPPTGLTGRFVAGTMLVDRYRIVTLLGRGGMGEVYKAEDLRLDQPVALKFLPETLALSPRALARFHAEVRIARQVSHPHVCRVYDIGELDGLQFLTMEFIDGEDLASLLRRIGRLPPDKAIELARQVCAGVAAAHEAGVLHRDLKPANVMVDGLGRVRLTDFGVAAIAREIRSENVLAGTPAYMAPELLKGEDATVRSDIYALGLVLYEMFTGKRAAEIKTTAEAASAAAIITPSKWAADIDPLVERALLRCLQKDPANRPASAIQVAAALPGGDPVQAALAAGETPSPEMVAAAGSRETTRPVAAFTTLAVTIAVLLLSTWGRDRTSVFGRVPVDLPPQVLAHKAREVLKRLGYSEPPADRAYGFEYNREFINYVRSQIDPALRWSRLEKGQPSAVEFWYRESRAPLQVLRIVGAPFASVTATDPPLTEPGMTLVHLDPKGRLLRFHAAPIPGAPPATEPTVNWTSLFALAELNPPSFQSVDPAIMPQVPFDARAAWAGVYPDQPDLPLRIEAAASQGRLVAIEMVGPWSVRPLQARPQAQPVNRLIMFLVAAAMAWRNVRLGRGDRRGALRIAVALFVIQQAAWLLVSDHVAGAGELILFEMSLGQTLVNSLVAYTLYLGFEPYVRRHWPELLVAWSRLLAGQIRDPLVGREALVGVALGATGSVATAVAYWAASSMATISARSQLDNVLNFTRIVGLVASTTGLSMLMALTACFLALLLRTVLRNVWLVAAVFVTVQAGFGSQGGYAAQGAPGAWLGAINGGLLGLFAIAALTRFGLVAVLTLCLTWGLLLMTPATLDMSAWYAGGSVFTIVILATLAAVACRVALGRGFSSGPRVVREAN